MYAITNTFKLDSSKIKSAIIHNFRTSDRFEEQIDYTMTQFNRVLFGPEEHLEKHVNERLRDFKVRKNSVLVLETLLTTSPEFFQQHGKDRNKLIDDWSKAALDFAKKEFGDNLVSAVLHLDEKTPHIHVMSLPITEDKRLSARDVNNRVALIDRQTGYAEAMKPFGLKRGEPVSTTGRKHQKLKDFYKAVNRAPEQVEKPTSIFGVMTASDFERYQNEMNESLYSLRVQLEEAERIAEQTKKANRELLEQNESLSMDKRAFEKRLRGVDILECVQELTRDGFLDKDGMNGTIKLSGKSINDGLVENGERIVRINDKKVKNAIDLVKEVLMCSFNEAIGYLKSRFDVSEVVNEYRPVLTNDFERKFNPLEGSMFIDDSIQVMNPKDVDFLRATGKPEPKGFDDKYNNEVLYMLKKNYKVGTISGGNTLTVRDDANKMTEFRHNGKSVMSFDKDSDERAISYSGREGDKRAIFVTTLGDLQRAQDFKIKANAPDLNILFIKTEKQWRAHYERHDVIIMHGADVKGKHDAIAYPEKPEVPKFKHHEQNRSRDLDFDR